MSIASGIRGPGRKGFIEAHCVNVFIKVFSEYVDGKASVDDVQCRSAYNCNYTNACATHCARNVLPFHSKHSVLGIWSG